MRQVSPCTPTPFRVVSAALVPGTGTTLTRRPWAVLTASSTRSKPPAFAPVQARTALPPCARFRVAQTLRPRLRAADRVEGRNRTFQRSAQPHQPHYGHAATARYDDLVRSPHGSPHGSRRSDEVGGWSVLRTRSLEEQSSSRSCHRRRRRLRGLPVIADRQSVVCCVARSVGGRSAATHEVSRRPLVAALVMHEKSRSRRKRAASVRTRQQTRMEPPCCCLASARAEKKRPVETNARRGFLRESLLAVSKRIFASCARLSSRSSPEKPC